MDADKKPGLAVVIAMKHKKMKDGAREEDGDKKYEEMAAELLKAVDSGDAKEVAKCLKSFVKVCCAECCDDDDKGDSEEKDKES